MMRILAIMFGVVAVLNLVRMGFYLAASEMYPRWRRRLVASAPFTEDELPALVVITPAHNEETTLEHCLQSVAQVDYPTHKILHIVVDDGSSDSTLQIAERFESTNPKRQVVVLTQANQGKAAALNNALQYLAEREEYDDYNIFMCLDADSALSTEAAKRGVEYFRNEGVCSVATHVKIVPAKGILNYLQRFEYLTCYRMKRAQTVLGFDYIIGGIGSMMRRDVFDQVGRYDTNTVTEDIDASMKLLQKFGNRTPTCIYAADVIAYTEACPDFGSLMRQRHRWKWGRTQTFFKQRRMFFNRDRRFKRSLTWVFLPLEVMFDVVFLLEPLFLLFLGYLIVKLGDWGTLEMAIVTVSLYMMLNAWREPFYSRRERLKFSLSAPFLYVGNYVLSVAEYAASARTFAQLRGIPGSMDGEHQTWASPTRSGAAIQNEADAQQHVGSRTAA